MERKKIEELWKLQKELEGVSKSTSRYKFSGAIKALEGEVVNEKFRDYFVPLRWGYYLRIARDKDGSLYMWLYDFRKPDELGISTLLAFEHHPAITQKLKFLIRYLSQRSQDNKNTAKENN